ncbi:hypothetical protein HPB50_006381 [Hyalomma asiaticum]|uniref:Uncharacterized protein n=1 Tax=Hyalomma asiaticum TaxID=266040 RepID=A0ACB7TJD5_HYAAI|nr:hypothetical protein HPB50_006381 [Hyalomma asiaticum]
MPPLPSPDSAASTQRPNTAPLPPSLDTAQTTELLTFQAPSKARGENLVNYSLVKFKLISGCPVTLTNTPSIAYAFQGTADLNLATTIAAQCPGTVSAYMDITSTLRVSKHQTTNAKPTAAHRSAEYANRQALSNQTSRPQRISAPPLDQQEA